MENLTLKCLSILMVASLIFTACGSDDDATPEEKDQAALEDLFNENPDNELGWDLSKDISTWGGVYLTDGRVTGLEVDGESLTSIPSSFGNLTSLTEVYLNGNDITSVPSSLKNLTSLTVLNLYDNALTNIPKEIAELTALTSLDIRSNSIGSLPEEVCNAFSFGTLCQKGASTCYTKDASTSCPGDAAVVVIAQ